MKLRYFFLTWFVLVTLLFPMFVEPCSAAFSPGNNITLERNGMVWEYKEGASDKESFIFREFVDAKTGNNDNFVNAWEILKAEMFLREKMRESIVNEPDVKLNKSAEGVKVENIDFGIPEEALGKTEKNVSIVNSAKVNYSFEKELDSGTEIWFMGTPESDVSITLPLGFDSSRTEGLNNKKIKFENNVTVLKGNFSPEKNITIWLSENKSFKADLQSIKEKEEKSKENMSVSREKETGNAQYILEIRESLGFLKGIFTHLYLSPKS